MTNELEICVETCKDCYLHAWCSRHDQTKYDTYFESFRLKVLQKFPKARILRNSPLPSYKKLPGKSSTGEGKYFDMKEEKIVYYPRLGSFEVTVNGVLVFSKIACSMWPNIQCLCHLVSKTLDSLRKGINPSLLSLSRRLTNDRNQSFISTQKNHLAKRQLDKCNSSQKVQNGKPRANSNLFVLKLTSKNNNSKISLKSRTLNLKKVSHKFSCYGLKEQNAGNYTQTFLPTSISKMNVKTKMLAHQNAHPKSTVFTKSHLIVPKGQKDYEPKRLSKVKTQVSQEQTNSINFEEKTIAKKEKIFIKQAISKNNDSLNGRSQVKSSSMMGHSLLSVEKTNKEADRLAKYPSFDTMVSEEKVLNEKTIQNDGKNTNFSEQVAQQQNLAVEIVHLKQHAKIMRSTSLHERLNKQQETSILIDEQDSSRKRQQSQQRPKVSVPFSYLMPAKMHDWSASVSMEMSQLERKIGKSVVMNEPTNILNNLEYASSCFKVQNSDANNLILQNDERDICVEETKTKKRLFFKEDCSKAHDVFFQQIEHVFKDNIPVLGISKSFDSNLIEPQIQHRDIKIQSPKFHFSKNTFLSDVYSEPIESSFFKCEQSDSHLFAEESSKQMPDIFAKHEQQF